MALKLNGDNSVSTPGFTGDDADTGLQCGTNELKLVTGGTTRATVDSSGNVGIGVSSPDSKLHVVDGLTGGQLLVATNDTNTTEKYGAFGTVHYTNSEEPALGIAVQSSSTENNVLIGGALGEFNSAQNIKFFTGANNTTTGGTERMRITSTGNILCCGATVSNPGAGNTSTGAVLENASDGATLLLSRTGNVVLYLNRNSDGAVTQILRSGVAVGSITATTSATAYNTSSDYRLKENVVDIADGIDRVKQLQPKRFNFIADAETTVDGFLAHEAQTVVPEAVTGTHNEVDDDGNAVMQGIDQSKLVPLLTAALQEAIAKIETLETKVAALEAAA